MQEVDGIGAHAASLLRLLHGLNARLELRKLTDRNDRVLLNTPERTARYAALLLSDHANEAMYLLCLNAQRMVLSAKPIGTGSLAELTVYPRTVAEQALLHRAHSVILVHNHPSGDPTPSSADADTTRAVQAALASVHIALIDHIVVGDGYVYSFSAQAMLHPIVETVEVLSPGEYTLRHERTTRPFSVAAEAKAGGQARCRND